MAGTERYVRNSTADFLVFTKDSETDGIEVRVQNHEVWLTQKGIGQLFDVDRSVVAKHLRNIFAENELSESTTCAKFAQVADNGKTYHYKFYSLPAIIAVGYRTNSTRATQFRQWATHTRHGYRSRRSLHQKSVPRKGWHLFSGHEWRLRPSAPSGQTSLHTRR